MFRKSFSKSRSLISAVYQTAAIRNAGSACNPINKNRTCWCGRLIGALTAGTFSGRSGNNVGIYGLVGPIHHKHEYI